MLLASVSLFPPTNTVKAATTSPDLSLDVVQSTSQYRVLRQLTELYIYDFTEIVGGDVDEEGSYQDAPPFAFIEDPLVHSYLIRVNGKLAGFAMVYLVSRITGERDVRDMNQFFVLRRYRRGGIGRKAAHLVFSHYPGRWEVRQLEANIPAQLFWRKTVERYGFDESCVERPTWREVVQRFEVSR